MAFRENVARAAQKMAATDYLPKETDPEYYTFSEWLTDEQADLLCLMELNQPTTADFLYEDFGRSVEDTKRVLDELVDLGVLVGAHVKGYDVYVMVIIVPGVYEMLVMNEPLVYAHPEIAKGFNEYTLRHFEKYLPNAPVGGGMMRVLPVEKAITGDTKIIKYDEVSYYIERNKEHLTVTGCQCRRSRRLQGEGCGHLEDDMCILMGAVADSIAKAGRGRRITATEAYEILRKAEDDGLVHQITNMDGMGKVFAICNCCTCSCFALRTSQYYNTPNVSRSNYLAEVDKEKCTACGQCVETCPANALKLGQKVCSKTPIEYTESITPDDHEWGPENYNPNYRESHENVVETGTAPCKTACPAHIAVQGYIKLASQGRYIEALELIKKENPLPAVCGRICPHNCESECTRGDIDDPIAIDEIKKFIADQELRTDYRAIPKKRHNYGKKMAVIGAGPAGLSCAYYLAIDGYKVTVFDKEPIPGGMLTMGIPSFRLEKPVVDAEIDILRDMGVEFKCGVEVGKDVTIPQLRAEGYKTFYLAIGAQGARKLGVEGEDADGVLYGVDFLCEINLNRSVKLGAKVLVIGGGNVAIDVARSAVRLRKVEDVEMFCLEQADEMAALPEEIEEAEGEGVTMNYGWGPKAILKDEDGKVRAVEFKKCTRVFDEQHHFSPQYDESTTQIVECDKVLVSIGQSIEWGQLLEGTKVVLGRGNAAEADSFTYQTAEPDIFVGGDAYTGPKFAIDAIAAGKQAAISMHRAAWDGQSLTIGRDRRVFKALDKDNVDRAAVEASFDNTSRQKIERRPDKAKTFVDDRQTFTEEQMKKETARCLGCGATVIDKNRCLGCGVCTTKCKFDAIHLVKAYEAPELLFSDLEQINADGRARRDRNIAIRLANEGK